MQPLRIVSLFDGIACGRVALRNLQVPVASYKASEIDKNAIAVAKANFPEIEHVGNVLDLHVAEGTCDLLCGGSPCQGLSRGGFQQGFDDPRSKLFWEWVRIWRECKPKYWLLENNPMKQHYEDIITETLGVAPIKINSALVSSANRKRLYWTNIPNEGKPKDRGVMLKDIVGEYEGIFVLPRGWNDGGIKSYNGKCPTITVSSWEHNFFLMKNGQKVPFTPEQAEAIMGLPIGYTSTVSKSKRFHGIGNGWNIQTIEYLFKGIVF